MFEHQGLACLAAFAAGSIPFGWIFAKLWGVGDIREKGSTNIGATNVMRTAGWLPGGLTFALDFAKGLIPVLYLPRWLDSPEWTIVVGFAAVLGHCYSPFLKFRGGKGVSTILGVLVAFKPVLGAATIAIYIAGLILTRVSAMGSLFAMLSALFLSLLFLTPVTDRIVIGLMIAVALARHNANWDKLLKTSSIAAIFFTVVSAGLTTRTHAAIPKNAPLIDFRGKEVRSASAPKRIATLMPALAEMVVDLGGGQSLVGVPEFSNLPQDIRSKVKVLGPYSAISAEAVYGLHPDVVLASIDGNDAALVTKLETLGSRVVTINTRSLADILKSIQIVAAAIGKSDSHQATEFTKALSQPAPKKERALSIFVEVGWDPIISVGKTTFIDDLITLAGGRNVLGDSPTRYPRPNAEEIVSRDPDVIVICQLTNDGTETERARAFWMQFKKMKAVKNNRVHVIPGDWIAKPGFSLVRGLEELRHIL